MACGDLSPPVPYSQLCHDLALVAPNGSTSNQRLVHTRFVFQNDQEAYAEGQPAAIAGLGGTFRLTAGETYWLTTTHLCFAPVGGPQFGDGEAIPFETLDGKLVTTQADLLQHDPSLAFDERCNAALADTPVRLFPAEASNEASVWLTLSGRFLYEYGSSVLERRRRVVEAGEKCSGVIEELLHQRDIYHSDCGLGLGVCQNLPSLPFRRVAARRLRIDLYPDGGGTVLAEHTKALEGVKQSYADSLLSAVLRLLVLLLTGGRGVCPRLAECNQRALAADQRHRRPEVPPRLLGRHHPAERHLAVQLCGRNHGRFDQHWRVGLASGRAVLRRGRLCGGRPGGGRGLPDPGPVLLLCALLAAPAHRLGHQLETGGAREHAGVARCRSST